MRVTISAGLAQLVEGTMTAESLMRGWMDSPHHRDNILGDFTQIGVALARDKDGAPYWCADFGTPWERLDPVRAGGDLVTALNRERTSADLRPLVAREKLTRAAQQIADHPSQQTLANQIELHPRVVAEVIVLATYSKLGWKGFSGYERMLSPFAVP